MHLRKKLHQEFIKVNPPLSEGMKVFIDFSQVEGLDNPVNSSQIYLHVI